ncbi:hypothetical protein MNEG_2990 [Monoraphidium neglectum]|uniref:Uncharacterized protein n=1 Tax=Monoraphidium neglectum TaxID=145388 RepID=A0A0D2LE32_9CHLO|nr:hypothetical protein MNEG_2990 [Monoraphidium neglectum]KIZ04974.1 hypothetical protein MNEG_2990 [Monoraphidium neglectum]|eukprot:XP_013903993.1 hypothetical protein MNEG_2990 [Monoraphidium neglectum]
MRRGKWSKQEDEQLLRHYRKWGNSWTKIAQFIGGRTDNAVKNRFVTLCEMGLVHRKPGRSARRGSHDDDYDSSCSMEYEEDEEADGDEDGSRGGGRGACEGVYGDDEGYESCHDTFTGGTESEYAMEDEGGAAARSHSPMRAPHGARFGAHAPSSSGTSCGTAHHHGGAGAAAHSRLGSPMRHDAAPS